MIGWSDATRRFRMTDRPRNSYPRQARAVARYGLRGVGMGLLARGGDPRATARCAYSPVGARVFCRVGVFPSGQGLERFRCFLREIETKTVVLRGRVPQEMGREGTGPPRSFLPFVRHFGGR